MYRLYSFWLLCSSTKKNKLQLYFIFNNVIYFFGYLKILLKFNNTVIKIQSYFYKIMPWVLTFSTHIFNVAFPRNVSFYLYLVAHYLSDFFSYCPSTLWSLTVGLYLFVFFFNSKGCTSLTPFCDKLTQPSAYFLQRGFGRWYFRKQILFIPIWLLKVICISIYRTIMLFLIPFLVYGINALFMI